MKVAFIVLSSLITLLVSAQKPIFRFTFEGIGDNREFHNGQSMSQTILGTVGSAQIGTTLEGHSVFAGISELYEFGSHLGFHEPWLILYYEFEGKGKQFRFGSFPRRGIVDFPLAMLADTLYFFRPNIEGLSGKLEGDRGYQMAFTDWTGRQTRTVRESFMAGTSGELKFGNVFLQNYILLNHLAHPAEMTEIVHIKDNLGFAFLAGVKLDDGNNFNSVLKAGWMASLYRERSVTDGFRFGNSFYFEGNTRFRNLGIRTTFHAGDKLEFAHGDPFFRFPVYFRADAIWYFIQYKNISGRFNWSLHWTDRPAPDHSQQLTVIYLL